MRSFTVIGTLILLILSTACMSTGDDITSPTGIDLLNSGKGADTFLDECRANMRSIASGCLIFFALNDTYPADMEALGAPYIGITCPGCGSTYDLEGNETDFALNCPLPTEPTHGSIINGVSSWNESFQGVCRDNMEAIAEACVIYFAYHSTYPADIETLGEPYSEMICLECGQSYDLRGDQEHYAVDCPLPPVISHGSIVDGVLSWYDPHQEGLYLCRANMRTIASQAVIFFATNDRFPTTLEEIGMAGVVCPTCNFTYQLIGTETEFYVGCPLPYDPTHGFIDGGVTSW